MRQETKINQKIYHTSNPIFRNKILSEGLICKGKSETWLSDTQIDGKVIFVTNSNLQKDWFDTTYNDDIYEIDTKNLPNKFFHDPNFKYEKNNKHLITFENIPLKNLKLIWSGNGKSWDQCNDLIIKKWAKFIEKYK